MFLTHQVIQLSCNGIANTGVAASDEHSLACSRHLKSEVKVLTLNPLKDSYYSSGPTQKRRGPKSVNLDNSFTIHSGICISLLININAF